MEIYYPDAETHKAKVLMGDSQALAYEWIVAYAANLTANYCCSEDEDGYTHDVITAEELLETAETHQPKSKNPYGEYICRGGVFEGYRLDPVFWDKFSLVMNIEREKVEETSFFTCSC